MATNYIKDLVIEVDMESIGDAISEALNNLSLDNLGDDGTTEFDIEDISVEYKDGKFVANIALQRLQGKFVSNQDIEEEIISQFSTTISAEIFVSI
jgi:hypothetical protein